MFLISLIDLFLLGMAMQCRGQADYDLRFESIVGIEGEVETLADFRNLKLIGRERLYNGSMFFAIDLIDDIKVSFETYIFRSGEWSLLPYSVTGITPCEFFNKFFFMYVRPEQMKTNFPPTIADYCPLRKGEYWVIEGKPHTDKWVTFLRRGLSKIRLVAYKNGKLIGGLECVANVVDRAF